MDLKGLSVTPFECLFSFICCHLAACFECEPFYSWKPPARNSPPSWAFLVIQVVLFEFENFQGAKAKFSAECKDVTEKGLEKVGSVIVDSGP